MIERGKCGTTTSHFGNLHFTPSSDPGLLVQTPTFFFIYSKKSDLVTSILVTFGQKK